MHSPWFLSRLASAWYIAPAPNVTYARCSSSSVVYGLNSPASITIAAPLSTYLPRVTKPVHCRMLWKKLHGYRFVAWFNTHDLWRNTPSVVCIHQYLPVGWGGGVRRTSDVCSLYVLCFMVPRVAYKMTRKSVRRRKLQLGYFCSVPGIWQHFLHVVNIIPCSWIMSNIWKSSSTHT